MNRLSELAGKVLQQNAVLPGNWRHFATSTFTVCPKPPQQLFLPPFPAFTFSSLHVYSLFFSLGRHINIGCAQGLCYDIFIVCVHAEDVDVNTAPYHTLNAALAG